VDTRPYFTKLIKIPTVKIKSMVKRFPFFKAQSNRKIFFHKTHEFDLMLDGDKTIRNNKYYL
jgi:hypothetical protein